MRSVLRTRLANDFGVARFNANGTVDTGFGGDGFVVMDFQA
ncbi:hypothetical protein ACIQWN_01010 [Streptomyces vinaceus]